MTQMMEELEKSKAGCQGPPGQQQEQEDAITRGLKSQSGSVGRAAASQSQGRQEEAGTTAGLPGSCWEGGRRSRRSRQKGAREINAP